MASSEPDGLSLRLVGIDYGAEGINVYRFASSDGQALPGFAPGAHVDLHVTATQPRQYSLIWPTPTPSTYALAVQVDEHGRGGSKALHYESVVGREYVLSQPRNHFGLNATASGECWLFAGGIGITPIVSMYRQLRQEGKPVRLFFWAKSPEQMLFRNELEGRDDVQLFFTAPSAQATQTPRLEGIIAQAPADAQLYCCGPSRMIDAFDSATAGRGAEHVHRERFSAAPQQDLGPGEAFRVSLRRSGVVLTVLPDETILSTCVSAGIDVPYSCEEGVCGACEIKVLAGQVSHRDSVLSPADHAKSESIMVCCSRGLTDLELDL